jgi:hypothetical protein
MTEPADSNILPANLDEFPLSAEEGGFRWLPHIIVSLVLIAGTAFGLPYLIALASGPTLEDEARSLASELVVPFSRLDKDAADATIAAWERESGCDAGVMYGGALDATPTTFRANAEKTATQLRPNYDAVAYVIEKAPEGSRLRVSDGKQLAPAKWVGVLVKAQCPE